MQDGEDSMCKGPEAGTCLAFLKNRNLKLEEGILCFQDFPGGAVVKNSPANAGNQSSIPGSGRSPGEGNGYPLQYACLENLMDRGDWQDRPWGHKESDMTEHAMLQTFLT